jgi:hypothetical protein
LLTSGNPTFLRWRPAVRAEFGVFPETPGYATIGAFYGPGFTTIGAVIRNTTDGNSAAGTLIPFCHLSSSFLFFFCFAALTQFLSLKAKEITLAVEADFI